MKIVKKRIWVFFSNYGPSGIHKGGQELWQKPQELDPFQVPLKLLSGIQNTGTWRRGWILSQRSRLTLDLDEDWSTRNLSRSLVGHNHLKLFEGGVTVFRIFQVSNINGSLFLTDVGNLFKVPFPPTLRTFEQTLCVTLVPVFHWYLLTSLRITQTGESVSTESRMTSRGPKVGSTSPSEIPFWKVPGEDKVHWNSSTL